MDTNEDTEAHEFMLKDDEAALLKMIMEEQVWYCAYCDKEVNDSEEGFPDANENICCSEDCVDDRNNDHAD